MRVKVDVTSLVPDGLGYIGDYEALDYYTSGEGRHNRATGTDKDGSWRAGYTLTRDGDGRIIEATYSSCAGNRATIARNGGAWIVTATGARHGLWNPIMSLLPDGADYAAVQACPWEYVETTEPSWAWWETKDSREAANA